MRYLLDTHVVLWWLGEQPERLSVAATEVIKNPANELFLSAASGWEIATKYRLGKLRLPTGFLVDLEERMTRHGIGVLSIRLDHSVRAGSFPAAHGDPFDRMLAAQAEVEDLTILTVDRAFAAFGVRTLW